MTHIGIDVHSRASQICELDDKGDVIFNTSIDSKPAVFKRFFANREPCLIAMEATGSTPWIETLLRDLGHDVLVLGANEVKIIGASVKKTDANDAEVLARLLSLDRRFLNPVAPKSKEQRLIRANLSCRAALVKSRTQAINCVRGLLRLWGVKVPGTNADTFPERVAELSLPEEISEALGSAVEGLLTHITAMTAQLKDYDKRLKKMAASDDAAQLLQTIPGVGPIIALSFTTVIGEASRFQKSARVGAYFGLVPRVRASANVCHMGTITKRGDGEMRRLLVQGAHMHLVHGKDTALCLWAKRLEARVGRRKAVVALARKLAVLMHRMLVTGMVYERHPGKDEEKELVSQDDTTSNAMNIGAVEEAKMSA